MCGTADWKKKSNWVAPVLGWSFLKEMKCKRLQLNSNCSQSGKRVCVYLCIKIAKLSCIFLDFNFSKRNEFENDAT